MCEKTKQLGQLMRTTRKARKMSLRVLSELTGIHSGAITKFELGQTNMTISRVFKISEVLGFSLADISPENIEQLENIELLRTKILQTCWTIESLQEIVQPLKEINRFLSKKETDEILRSKN